MFVNSDKIQQKRTKTGTNTLASLVGMNWVGIAHSWREISNNRNKQLQFIDSWFLENEIRNKQQIWPLKPLDSTWIYFSLFYSATFCSLEKRKILKLAEKLEKHLINGILIQKIHLELCILFVCRKGTLFSCIDAKAIDHGFSHFWIKSIEL